MIATASAWVTEDPASRRVLEFAQKVVEAPTTVLITGESGTGKDQLARWIHDQGARRDAPFLKIDCASLPRELVESELFGHERGAFTGAFARKPGRFELAQSGTLVLDEIGALDLGTQAKLLRVLEERKFERLGGTDTLRLDARLVALTNADLERAVQAGRFREDLFFRMNVLIIAVPPLRERRADILPLVACFIDRLAPIHGRQEVRLDPVAAEMLQDYSWPGNVRELKNAVEHALIFSQANAGQENLLRPGDFPEILRSADRSVAPGGAFKSLEEIEKQAIQATLEATHFKIAKSAEILGISRKTLLEKRKKYGLI